MIIGRKSDQEIRCDFLRLVHNRSLIYSQNIFVIGKGQTGKSTWVFYTANRLKQIQLGIPLKRATWREWDYEKFTTTTPSKFVELWDKYSSEIISLEEAGEQMNYLEWFGLMSRVFSSTTATQGLKLNTCFLITPYFDDIVKHARSRMDYVAILHHRSDVHRSVVATPKYCRLNWKTLQPEFRPISNMVVKYPARALAESKNYTNWLKGYKQDISEKNKELVGLIKKPTLSEELKKEVDKELKLEPVKRYDNPYAS